MLKTGYYSKRWNTDKVSMAETCGASGMLMKAQVTVENNQKTQSKYLTYLRCVWFIYLNTRTHTHRPTKNKNPSCIFNASSSMFHPGPCCFQVVYQANYGHHTLSDVSPCAFITALSHPQHVMDIKGSAGYSAGLQPAVHITCLLYYRASEGGASVSPIYF